MPPKIIKNQVHTHQPQNHNNTHQLSFEPNSDHTDQCNSDNVPNDFQRTEFQMHQAQKHQNQQQPSTQQHVVFVFLVGVIKHDILGKNIPTRFLVLSKQQKNSSDQR